MSSLDASGIPPVIHALRTLTDGTNYFIGRNGGESAPQVSAQHCTLLRQDFKSLCIAHEVRLKAIDTHRQTISRLDERVIIAQRDSCKNKTIEFLAVAALVAVVATTIILGVLSLAPTVVLVLLPILSFFTLNYLASCYMLNKILDDQNCSEEDRKEFYDCPKRLHSLFLGLVNGIMLAFIHHEMVWEIRKDAIKAEERCKKDIALDVVSLNRYIKEMAAFTESPKFNELIAELDRIISTSVFSQETRQQHANIKDQLEALKALIDAARKEIDTLPTVLPRQ